MLLCVLTFLMAGAEDKYDAEAIAGQLGWPNNLWMGVPGESGHRPPQVAMQ